MLPLPWTVGKPLSFSEAIPHSPRSQVWGVVLHSGGGGLFLPIMVLCSHFCWDQIVPSGKPEKLGSPGPIVGSQQPWMWAQLGQIFMFFRRSQKSGIKCEIYHYQILATVHTFLKHCAGPTKQTPLQQGPQAQQASPTLIQWSLRAGTTVLCYFSPWYPLQHLHNWALGGG